MTTIYFSLVTWISRNKVNQWILVKFSARVRHDLATTNSLSRPCLVELYVNYVTLWQFNRLNVDLQVSELAL